MEKLKENVMKEVQCELDRANEKFPPFNGMHESYAVILEEAEETEEALEAAKASLSVLWDKVRGKNVPPFLKDATRPAYLAEEFVLVACEAIQTAAMCLKYGLSVPGEERSCKTCINNYQVENCVDGECDICVNGSHYAAIETNYDAGEIAPERLVE